ncbi:MAG: ABC transporter ATP-binding protein [Bacteroidota bacterium]
MDSIKNIVKKYFENFLYFYRHIRYRIFVQISMSIGVGILDGFGLAMFLPLLQMVDSAPQVSSDKLGNLNFLIEGMEYLGLGLTLMTVLSFLLVFFALKGIAQYISALHQVKVQQIFIKKIRVNLIDGLGHLSYKAFVMSDAGKIQNTLSGEVDRIARAYQTYLTAFQQMVLVIVYMAFAFFIEPKFAVLITIGGALTNIIYKQIYVNTKGASRKLTSEANRFQNLVIQYVSNFKYLKATGSLPAYGRKLKGSVDIIEENNRRIGKLGAILVATKEPLLILVVCTVIYIQVNLMGGSLGPILISLLFFYRALAALIQMQTQYNLFLAVSGSMSNMAEFSSEVQRNSEVEGAAAIDRFEGPLVLESAVFKYNDTVILKDISLNIRRNETVAFVGESGSGKTTLVNVLTGLMPLDAGQMRVGNIERSALNVTSFQQRIGYITQEPVIFNDSIFNNVTFWADPQPENKIKFGNAVYRSSVSDFLNDLPDKELTLLGNNGINLSGGQKQRISIARELYKDVDILVFDEATSALDSETERAIQNNIEDLYGKYTVLIIAHRLSTVKHADRIILMKKGRIVDQGSFSELMEKSATFRKMVELQDV